MLNAEAFKQRFITLVLKSSGMPRRPRDRQILLLSAALGITPGRDYGEKQINAVLQEWTNRFGDRFGLDHVTLRRLLVDAGYLLRDNAGVGYQLSSELPPVFETSELHNLDLTDLVTRAVHSREQKKRAFLQNKDA